MHEFPSKEKDQKGREWVYLVHKHRSNFVPSLKSYLCSAHFETSAFSANLSAGTFLAMKRKLKNTAILTVDVAEISDLTSSTDRYFHMHP